MENFSIPLAAVIISLTTLIITTLSLRYKASDDYVRELEKKLEKLQNEVRELESELSRLKEENYRLLKRIVECEK
jgi:cell division protein FtsB